MSVKSIYKNINTFMFSWCCCFKSNREITRTVILKRLSPSRLSSLDVSVTEDRISELSDPDTFYSFETNKIEPKGPQNHNRKSRPNL